MTNSSNELAFVLLASMEARLKTKGKASMVPDIVRRLRKAGAHDDLIGQVQALHAGKPAAPAKGKKQQSQGPKAAIKPVYGPLAVV